MVPIFRLSNGTWNEIPVTKVTSNTFYIGTSTIVYAIKMAGTNAGKTISAYFCNGGQGSIEFDNDSDYNIYKSGSGSSAITNAEICLKVYCIGISTPFLVGVGEAADDGEIPLSIDDWQTSIEFPSE